MEAKLLKDKIVTLLEDKKGGDITTIDMSAKSSITDYFVITTGRNVNHVKTLAEETQDKLEAEGVFTLRKEGLSDGRWAVLDYGDVIVHIFNADTRDYFCLEKLWK